MPKDSQPDPKQSAFNKDSLSTQVSNEPKHTRDYHRAAGDGTITKK